MGKILSTSKPTTIPFCADRHNLVDVSISHFSDSTWKKLARTIAEKSLSMLVLSQVRCELGLWPVGQWKVIAGLGRNFQKRTGPGRIVLSLKVSTLRKSVIFLPVDGAHREITWPFSKAHFSDGSKVPRGYYEIFWCLTGACLLSTEINSAKSQGLYLLSGRELTRFQ